MENYISEQLLKKIESIYNSNTKTFLTGETNGVITLFKLLNALPLNTDFSIEEVEKISRQVIGSKNYESWSDIIVFAAVKNQRLNILNFKNTGSAIENHSAYYMLDVEDALHISKSNGIVCKGSEYNGEEFFENCNVTDLPISNSWDPICNKTPPTNAMLIVDKYIFGSPLEKKLNSLVEFIKLYKSDLNIPFHLSILFSFEGGGPKSKDIVTEHQVSQIIKKLVEIGNIEVQLLADNNLPHDRMIYTNYTSGNIGIPFTGVDTRFTQKFLGMGNKSIDIQNNYELYKRELSNWKSRMDKIPSNMGLIKMRWETSDFNNRLFDFVKLEKTLTK
jgi:hypothetical protein